MPNDLQNAVNEIKADTHLTAAETKATVWSMGLGALGPIANLTATGLIGLLLYILVNDMRQQAREDRTMFREELRELHKDANKHERALFDVQQIMAENTIALRQLTEEVRRGKPTP